MIACAFRDIWSFLMFFKFSNCTRLCLMSCLMSYVVCHKMHSCSYYFQYLLTCYLLLRCNIFSNYITQSIACGHALIIGSTRQTMGNLEPGPSPESFAPLLTSCLFAPELCPCCTARECALRILSLKLCVLQSLIYQSLTGGRNNSWWQKYDFKAPSSASNPYPANTDSELIVITSFN